MKKLLITIALLWSVTFVTWGWTVPDQRLSYNVSFKWGMIDANMGVANIATFNIPGENRFLAHLSGESVKILTHRYVAEASIKGTLIAGELSPGVNCVTICNEKGMFAIETITKDIEGPSKLGPVTNRLSNGEVVRSRVSNYGSGLTLDLLGVYYYIRQIDYSKSTPGQKYHFCISNGSQSNLLDVEYLGKEDLDDYGETFHISFSFTSRSSGKADTMQAWISTSDSRIPLVINGSLSIGHITCRYLDSTPILSLPEAIF